jgi:2-dehydropantoate 2-reductase
MRICIHGAGAIGGTMAARLARAGRDVVAVARGAHLEAMRAEGLLFRERPGAAPQRIALRCAASAAEAGPFDLVVCTAKAHDLPAMAEDLAAALAPDGAVAFAVNGVPWWFFHGIGGPHEGAVVEAVDPGGLLARRLGARRAIGAVIHFLAALEAPGIVAQHAAGRLVLGEPDGTMSPRLAAATAALDVPGWTLEATARIRDEVAGKFMGNATSNPLCALLRVPIGRVFRDPVLAAFGERVMVEARAVARASRRAWTNASRSTATGRSRRSAPRPCSTSTGAGRWRSTRCCSPSPSSAAARAWRRPRSTLPMRWSARWRRGRASIPARRPPPRLRRWRRSRRAAGRSRRSSRRWPGR